MKRILAMALSVLLIAGMAIGGSVAYLTSTDSDTNVFTMGEVKIKQIEQQRDANGGYVEFQNAQKLYPAHYSPVKEPEKKTDPTEPAKAANGFYSDIKGAMDKIVSVQNTGKSNAYIRTWFAFEADNTANTTVDNAGLKYIHINWNGIAKGGTKAVKYGSNPVKIGADNNEFIVYSVTYPEAIEPGESTAYSLLEVFMDKAADNDYVAQFGDEYEILVLSQGVQAENFESAQEALDAAFGSDAPWDTTTNIAVPTFIKTAEELKTAISSIKDLQNNESLNITLGADIDLNGVDWSDVPDYVEINCTDSAILIDGNGYTIKNLSSTGKNVAGLIPHLKFNGPVVIRNLKINGVEFSGTNGEGECAGGAVIGYYESHGNEVSLTLENVHVTGADIKGYKYIGGLVGYLTGDGSHITITNCSVNGSTLNSTFEDKEQNNKQRGHVGGLIGYFHSGSVNDSTVMETNIIGSTYAKRHGAMIGTAKQLAVVGTGNKVIDVKINDTAVTEENKTIVGAVDNRQNMSNDGVTVTNTTNKTIVSDTSALHTAIKNKVETINLTAGTYTPDTSNGPISNVKIVGSGDKGSVKIEKLTSQYDGVTFSNLTINDVSYLYLKGTTTFENCVFTGKTGAYSFHAEDTKGTLKFVNCVFENKPVCCGFYAGVPGEKGTVTFENCKFNFASVAEWGNLRSYVNTSIENCTFNLTGATHSITDDTVVTVKGGNYASTVVRTGKSGDKGTVVYE